MSHLKLVALCLMSPLFAAAFPLISFIGAIGHSSSDRGKNLSNLYEERIAELFLK